MASTWVEEIRNGLRYRHCFPRDDERFGKCGHFVETREETNETDICEQLYDTADGHITWRGNSVSQAEVVAYIHHQPRCRHCLQHDNSYLFPAWYDISQEQADRLADLYLAHYPEDGPQPLFYAWGNRSMRVRPAGSDGHEDGYIDLDTMEATLVYIEPAAPRGHTRRTIDLTRPEAWRALVEHSGSDANGSPRTPAVRTRG